MSCASDRCNCLPPPVSKKSLMELCRAASKRPNSVHLMAICHPHTLNPGAVVTFSSSSRVFATSKEKRRSPTSSSSASLTDDWWASVRESASSSDMRMTSWSAILVKYLCERSRTGRVGKVKIDIPHECHSVPLNDTDSIVVPCCLLGPKDDINEVLALAPQQIDPRTEPLRLGHVISTLAKTFRPMTSLARRNGG